MEFVFMSLPIHRHFSVVHFAGHFGGVVNQVKPRSGLSNDIAGEWPFVVCGERW